MLEELYLLWSMGAMISCVVNVILFIKGLIGLNKVVFNTFFWPIAYTIFIFKSTFESCQGNKQ